MQIKNCNCCGKQFESSRKHKIFCSEECRLIVWKAKHSVLSTKRYRKKEGTYEKWASALRNEGWIVVPPKKSRTKKQ